MMGTSDDVASRMQSVLEAARAVEHWYYERDALWVKLTQEEREQADRAVLALHDALVLLGESGVVEEL